MFSFLQNSLKVSGVRFILVSEAFFLGSPNSANFILAACSRTFAARLATFLQLELTLKIYSTKNLLVLIINMPAPTTSHGLRGMSQCSAVSCSFLH